MERVICGMPARSKAGHDKGRLYLICKVTDTQVYLCDGKCRTLEHPKKKNRKHIQVICEIPDGLENWDGISLKNEEIRAILKKYEEV